MSVTRDQVFSIPTVRMVHQKNASQEISNNAQQEKSTKIETARTTALARKALIMFIVSRSDISDYLTGNFEEDTVKLFQSTDPEFDEDYDPRVVR